MEKFETEKYKLLEIFGKIFRNLESNKKISKNYENFWRIWKDLINDENLKNLENLKNTEVVKIFLKWSCLKILRWIHVDKTLAVTILRLNLKTKTIDS